MTANTTRARVVDFSVRAFDRNDDVLMTLPASLFRYVETALRDVNVVFEPTSCEVVGMPESVACFRHVLRNESRWRVAIVAHSDRAMARLQPAAELLLHDMTIHAGFGVVSHVRIAARVDKRVGADPDRHAEDDAKYDPACKSSANHLLFRMALNALKHRDVTEIDRMPERFVGLVTRFALAIRESAEIDGMLKVARR